jgi:hypothetical protein
LAISTTAHQHFRNSFQNSLTLCKSNSRNTPASSTGHQIGRDKEHRSGADLRSVHVGSDPREASLGPGVLHRSRPSWLWRNSVTKSSAKANYFCKARMTCRPVIPVTSDLVWRFSGHHVIQFRRQGSRFQVPSEVAILILNFRTWVRGSCSSPWVFVFIPQVLKLGTLNLINVIPFNFLSILSQIKVH